MNYYYYSKSGGYEVNGLLYKKFQCGKFKTRISERAIYHTHHYYISEYQNKKVLKIKKYCRQDYELIKKFVDKTIKDFSLKNLTLQQMKEQNEKTHTYSRKFIVGLTDCKNIYEGVMTYADIRKYKISGKSEIAMMKKDMVDIIKKNNLTPLCTLAEFKQFTAACDRIINHFDKHHTRASDSYKFYFDILVCLYQNMKNICFLLVTDRFNTEGTFTPPFHVTLGVDESRQVHKVHFYRDGEIKEYKGNYENYDVMSCFSVTRGYPVFVRYDLRQNLIWIL